MHNYYRASDMIDFWDFFPDASPLERLAICFDKEDYIKNKEYLEFANLRGDYKSSILSLIDHRKIKECLFTLSSMVQGGVTLENPLPKEIFFNYSNLFIKECPKESIDLLENYFIVNDKQDEIIKILNYPNYKMLAKEEENFKIVLNFIKKLIRKKFKILMLLKKN